MRKEMNEAMMAQVNGCGMRYRPSYPVTHHVDKPVTETKGVGVEAPENDNSFLNWLQKIF